MTQDCFGQSVSLETDKARRAWDQAQLCFLAHDARTPMHLAAVLEAEPQFALGHAVKGLFSLLLGRRELQVEADRARDMAETAVAEGQCHPRERLYLAALGAYLDGWPGKAGDHLATVLRTCPQDALAMKLSHAIRFVRGDSDGMRRSVERILPAYDRDHPARGYLLGCHAFALEETGAYAAAQVAGRQALWAAPDDAWGCHAVAHVHEMTGDASGGIDWLTGREATWAHCNNFRYHVWWHKALLHLDLGQVAAVLELYDTKIRAEQTDDYRDIANAASLLARLEADGIDVGTRWEELAEISARRTEDGCLVFADLHYLLALIGGGRSEAIARLMARLERDAARRDTEIRDRMAMPGLAVAQGLCAFGDGAYDRAFRALLQARPLLQRAGGSHAQRDVFERLTVDAGLRAGYLGQVEDLLKERQALRGGREDGYAAARRAMIAAARAAGGAAKISAQ